MRSRGERLRGGIYGLLVGDAFGVPYEFHEAEELASLGELDLFPPAGFPRSHPAVPPGTWSDDGAQALALLDSLLTCGRLDPEDLAGKLLAWAHEGRYAVGGLVFDIGVTTQRALDAIRRRAPALTCGPTGERDNGNGALMRVLPLALWHPGDDASLIRDARDQSRVTHGHLRSQLACAHYCLWARRLLRGTQDGDDAFEGAVEDLRLWTDAVPGALEEIEDHLVRCPPGGPGGSGYVVDSLHSARHALRSGGYEQVVRAAVALGRDTDTTACIAGGLAGIRDGVGGIPGRWLDALRGRELVETLVERLVTDSAPAPPAA
jgi:ADP-ribosylglycohydrolase